MRILTLALLLILAFTLPAVSLNTTDGQRSKPRATARTEAAQIPTPEDILGFRPGDDRKLASWNQVTEYFHKLAAASDRVKFEQLGKSTMGVPFVLATISAPENLARLEEYKKIQDLLADPRKLERNPDRQARQLIARGKTIVLITCGIHSTEVGSYLSSMLIAHRLASSNDPEIQEILKNCIILLVPSLNPDGVDIVKNWYDKTLGTPYEGTDPPMLYHKYTGHDNNRDWYAFTQVETQITVDKIHNVWHPQIVHDIHQQGAYGARLFLPPYMQPIEPNVPKQIVEGYTELGNYLARQMRGQEFKGITTDSTYDAWSPSRAYSHYHGGVRILSETASCKIATPISVKFEELRSREGYDPQKESANFGPVWRGGEWHLRDITNYMTAAAFLLLKHAAAHREEWLHRFYDIGKEAVQPRKPGESAALIVSLQGDDLQSLTSFSNLTQGGQNRTATSRGAKAFQRDVDRLSAGRFLMILLQGGVELYRVACTMPKDRSVIEKHDYLIPATQPYGAFARALLIAQKYPDLRGQSGLPIAPYDVTAHTLSLLMGIDVKDLLGSLPKPEYLERIFKIQVRDTPCTPQNPCLVSVPALYKSYVPSIDEGWTRWMLEHQVIGPNQRYLSVEDADIRRGGLKEHYEVVVLPDQPPNTILGGNRPGTMPPEYTGGLGSEGVKSLREFIEQGGTLVCLNRASDFAIEQFKLPLRDVVAGLPRTDFYVPGSILRIELDTSNPIAAGMPKESIAWAEDSPVFEIVERKEGADKMSGRPGNTGSTPVPQVHIIARYPRDKNPLLSGWLLGGDRIKGKAALVDVTMGKGHVILFGFRPQYRGQSLATYPLFFNALRGN